MHETLEKSFEKSKSEQNKMQRNIGKRLFYICLFVCFNMFVYIRYKGLNMAAFGADSILWATSQLYEKNKIMFDNDYMV